MENKLQIDVGVNMKIILTEVLFPFDVRRESPRMEKEIEKELEKQFAQLIKKIQAAKIDPAGFGLFARAKQYQQWKAVQDQWGEAFAESDVKVNVNVKMMGIGAIK